MTLRNIEINLKSAEIAASEAVHKFQGWDLVQMLSVSENIIFEVGNEAGDKAVLRVHRPNYQTRSSIQSELLWMAFLAANGITTPEPIKTKSGGYITTTTSKLQVSMLSWIEGETLQSLHARTIGLSPEIEALYFRLGKKIGTIHNASDNFRHQPMFERDSWDLEGLLGDNPKWGRFWENPSLAEEEITFLLRLKSTLRGHLQRYMADGADFGLIHADVISENVLVHNGEPIIIDYDDSGFGFRMYDLAVPLYRFFPSPNYEKLAGLLKSGYKTRRQLSEESWKLLDVFVLLRRLALLGWVVPRKPPHEITSRTRENIKAVTLLAHKIDLTV